MSLNSDELFGSGVPTWTQPTNHHGNMLGGNGNLATVPIAQTSSSGQALISERGDANNLTLRIFDNDHVTGARSNAEGESGDMTGVKIIYDDDDDGFISIDGEIADCSLLDIQSDKENKQGEYTDVQGQRSNVQQGQTILRETSSEMQHDNTRTTSNQPFHPVGIAMLQGLSQEAAGESSPGARAKTTRHKNKVLKHKGKTKSADDSNRVTGPRPCSNGITKQSGFQPKLRVKKYDNDALTPTYTDIGQKFIAPRQELPRFTKSRVATTVNGCRQKRDGHVNGIALENAEHPDIHGGASSQFQFPAGIDPYSNPKGHPRFYIKQDNTNSRVTMPHPMVDSNNSDEFHSVSHVTSLINLNNAVQSGDADGANLHGNEAELTGEGAELGKGVELGREKVERGRERGKRGRLRAAPGRDGLELGRETVALGSERVELGRQRMEQGNKKTQLGRERVELFDERMKHRENSVDLVTQDVELCDNLCDSDNESETSVKILNPRNHIVYRNDLRPHNNVDPTKLHIAPKNVNIDWKNQAKQIIQPVYDCSNQAVQVAAPLTIHNNLQTGQSVVNAHPSQRDCVHLREGSSSAVEPNSCQDDDHGLPSPPALLHSQESNILRPVNDTVLQPCSEANTSGNLINIDPRPEHSQDQMLIIQPDDSFSDVPSALLFGEGDEDYLLARNLQAKYDRETEEMHQQQELDILPDEMYFRNIPDSSPRIPCPESGNQNYYIVESLSTESLEADANNYIDDGTVLPIPAVHDPQGNGNLNLDFYSNPITPGQIGNDERYPESNESHSLPSDTQYQARVQNLLPPVDFQRSRQFSSAPSVISRESQALDDEELARRMQEELNLATELEDERFARQLQEDDRRHHVANDFRPHVHTGHQHNVESGGYMYQPLHTRYNREPAWRDRQERFQTATNVADSRIRGQESTERPLQRLLERFETRPVNVYRDEGVDIPPQYMRPHYGNNYNYEFGPDDENFVSMTRDPHILASFLMERSPGMMIPNHVNLNDYEALWELAERLGEVRKVGMEQREISILPVHTYQPTADSENSENTDCRVCLTDFKVGEQLRTLPCCHTYHVDCIDQWLKRNAICPVCRQSVHQPNTSM